MHGEAGQHTGAGNRTALWPFEAMTHKTWHDKADSEAAISSD